MQNDTTTPFEVIQGHQFKSSHATNLLTYTLSCTIAKLLQIIGQIFASDRELPLLNKPVQVNLWNQDYEIWWNKKLETSLLSYNTQCILIP